MKPLDATTYPLSSNRLIEASAGTGKTYTITNLYLRLLLGRTDAFERPLAVNEILVLTFTIAATEELRTRIRSRIIEARRAFSQPLESGDDFLVYLKQSSPDVERDSRLLSAALQLLDEASIYTIHGFCARVLADNAFETGTLFDQSLDADRDVLLETATQDCFRSHILTLPRMQRAIALRLWPSPEILFAKLKPFLFREGLTMLPPQQDLQTELAGLVDKIERARAGWLEDDIPALINDAGFRKGSKCLSRLAPMTEWCRGEELDTDLWENWSDKYLHSVITKGGTVPSHPVLTLIDEIHQAGDLVEHEQFNLWQQVAQQVRANLNRYKLEQFQLTLDDLLVKVHEALHSRYAGPVLAASLAQRWPAALIDEFQDTDDVQAEIFTRIYRDRAGTGLHYIGDPKQAIYQFRGADVFTYINAKRAVDPEDAVFSLSTNWRSNARLVQAVNTLFTRPGIFDNDRDIPFVPVDAAPGADARRMTVEGKEVAPVSLTQFASNERRLTKDPARRLAMDHAAEEASRLLTLSGQGQATINHEPLRAGQIAVLVRDKNDARAARAAFAARGIGSVYVTLESVFLTETADDLRLILQAVLEPTNERALRSALAVPLLQSTAAEIADLSVDVTAQQRVLKEFSDYHHLWATMDVATMIESLMKERRIAQKWFGRPNGERQITNLRHLTELLQQRASTAPGMHRLLKWFTREKLAADTVAAEERQLRLESDRDLVQIVTMHASKGLEYDIVMIPMTAFIAQDRDNEPCMFHEVVDGQFEARLDFSGDINHREAAYAEKQAEDMRLLYVAITRAKYKCYLGIPNLKDLERAAIGKLLGLTEYSPEGVDERLCRLDTALFQVELVESAALTPWVPVAGATDLVPPPPPPTLRSDWRVHSYTGVTRLIQRTEAASSSGFDVTPGFGDDENVALPGLAAGFDRFAFPRGPRAGVALHTLMEHLDFTVPVGEQAAVLGRCLDRLGLTQQREQWLKGLTNWTGAVLAAPLPCDASLADIPRARRLDELEFHFPFHAGQDLLDVLASRGYLDPSRELRLGDITGMMTGLIDLVFEHDGRYYLVDYKSNHLGNEFENYEAAPVRATMVDHQYDLQYLIYTVALTRYLRQRITDFSFEKHFGGAIYLFMRGLTPDGETGIYFDRPDEAFVSELDTLLGGAP